MHVRSHCGPTGTKEGRFEFINWPRSWIIVPFSCLDFRPLNRNHATCSECVNGAFIADFGQCCGLFYGQRIGIFEFQSLWNWGISIQNVALLKRSNGYIGMCANLIHIFLIFCHIFEILKINYFSGFTALRSDRAIRYFYFFKLLYFVNTFEWIESFETKCSKFNIVRM